MNFFTLFSNYMFSILFIPSILLGELLLFFFFEGTGMKNEADYMDFFLILF